MKSYTLMSPDVLSLDLTCKVLTLQRYKKIYNLSRDLIYFFAGDFSTSLEMTMGGTTQTYASTFYVTTANNMDIS